jgi:hypothetical protein
VIVIALFVVAWFANSSHSAPAGASAGMALSVFIEFQPRP